MNEENVMEMKKPDVHPLLDLSHEPVLNVIDSDTFQERVEKVFQMTAESLARSYGPYGSSAILENYPFHHATKDGYSIMKRLSFSKEHTAVDDAIRDLISTPCSRLNNAVGDGTTTAIIAVNSIYKYFVEYKSEFEKNDIPPRDIMKAYNSVCEKILDKLDEETIRVNVGSHDEMVSTMSKIAYISSNGDEEITKLITELYDELDYPLINIENADDGITKKVIISGYQFDAVLKDAMYINNDNRTGVYTTVDFLLFDYKIGQDVFQNIIYPLNEECRKLGRHLAVIAPMYDEVCIANVARHLMGEYQQMHDVNLILLAGSISTPASRSLYEDLAMLLNTTIINRGFTADIISVLKDEAISITRMIDIDHRGIPGIYVNVTKPDGTSGWTTDNGEIPEDYLSKLHENAIRAGYAGHAVFGLTKKAGIVLNQLPYDKTIYDATIKEVEYGLSESLRKGQALGALNLEASNLQTRLYKLKMKMGTIEVGGSSAMSVEMTRDVVDDTVKATVSAYHNGILHGCSTGTLRAIWSLLSDQNELNSVERTIAYIIFYGFLDVYKTLLQSRHPEYETEICDGFFLRGKDSRAENAPELLMESALERYNQSPSKFVDKFNDRAPFNVTCEDIDMIFNNKDLFYGTTSFINGGLSMVLGISIYDMIIRLSMLKNEAYDLTTKTFNPDIINSARTDREVLIASTDLISLLITGNQFVMSGE